MRYITERYGISKAMYKKLVKGYGIDVSTMDGVIMLSRVCEVLRLETPFTRLFSFEDMYGHVVRSGFSRSGAYRLLKKCPHYYVNGKVFFSMYEVYVVIGVGSVKGDNFHKEVTEYVTFRGPGFLHPAWVSGVA